MNLNFNGIVDIAGGSIQQVLKWNIEKDSKNSNLAVSHLNFIFLCNCIIWADPRSTAILGQPGQNRSKLLCFRQFPKISLTFVCPAMRELPDVKLIRTDTTLWS